MTGPITYEQTGVSIEAKASFADGIRRLARSTYGPRVLGELGGFAGLFRIDYDERLFQRRYRRPVLVACADGVGTKLLIAAKMKRFNTVGIDLVAMNVNDLITTGAEPLFFVDYLALHKIDETAVGLVEGIVSGCRQAGCSLIGGETADMPDIYRRGQFDMAGFAVGIVDRHKIVLGRTVEPNDSIIGLASSGLHSNGYSLIRRVVKSAKLKLDKYYKPIGGLLGNVLLEPTRIYVSAVLGLLKHYKVKKVVKAMAHITGGGIAGNLRRVLPPDVDARIEKDRFPKPPIFPFIQQLGPIDEDEMYRVFNMGIGFVLIVAPAFTRSIMGHLRKLGEKPYFIGKVKRGSGQVLLS